MAVMRSTKVPKEWQDYYASMTVISDDICRRHLNEEYAELARCALAALCRKRPSPLSSGHKQVWVCAVVYALGQVNFLTDKASTPCMTMAELCAAFDVAGSTAANKAKVVRDLLGMRQFDPEWKLPSRAADNPLTWLLRSNGLLLGARNEPGDMLRRVLAQVAIADKSDDHGRG